MSAPDPYGFVAGLYPTAKEAVTVARRANLPIEHLETEGTAITVWCSILAQARKRRSLAAVAEVIERDYPGVNAARVLTAGGLNGDEMPVVRPRWPISINNYERITGTQATFLPISFLALGLVRARSVVKITRADGSCGSGFLTTENLVVTNNHVLPSVETAASARADFGYEIDSEGDVQSPVGFRLRPDVRFQTSKENDWTVVRIDGDANRDWGAIPLVKTSAVSDQFVNIIQHPGGGPKQIALYHNVVTFVDATRVQYLTDTMHGSSGSPVFDTEWRVVAIHHAGGLLRQPGRETTLFCNEGIAVNALLDDLARMD